MDKMLVCVLCGKTFVARGYRTDARTCSEKCSKILYFEKAKRATIHGFWSGTWYYKGQKVFTDERLTALRNARVEYT